MDTGSYMPMRVNPTVRPCPFRFICKNVNKKVCKIYLDGGVDGGICNHFVRRSKQNGKK